MRNLLIAFLSLLAFSAIAAAQAISSSSLADKLNSGPGGPAPRHDLTGTWVGPIGLTGTGTVPGEKPQFTSVGQQRFALNKPEGKVNVSGTNDPFMRTCDPVGFPRNMLIEVRGVPAGELIGMTLASLPDRVLLLSQFQQTWREIWTDGRALPNNVGAAEKGAPDPRYYGYSVGHWEADNIFVVDTTGIDDSTWLNKLGYPHTVEAHVQERYTRVDRDDLQLTISVDDPKLYTKPFVLATIIRYRRLTDQTLGEQLCIPSKLMEYLSVIDDQSK